MVSYTYYLGPVSAAAIPENQNGVLGDWAQNQTVLTKLPTVYPVTIHIFQYASSPTAVPQTLGFSPPDTHAA